MLTCFDIAYSSCISNPITLDPNNSYSFYVIPPAGSTSHVYGTERYGVYPDGWAIAYGYRADLNAGAGITAMYFEIN